MSSSPRILRKKVIFTKYKITVYAIAKNEERFARRWYESMREADHVCVLDTGSTDNTVGLLRELGATVEEAVVSPWRFDAARNASMKLIPPDTDICVCADLDEVFKPGWRRVLSNGWGAGITRARYRYIWNFTPEGTPGTVFLGEKIHSNGGFRWVHPVHEVLTYEGEEREKFIPGLCLEHHADMTKSRADYLPLLELAVEEDPDGDRNMHYLGREYYFRGMNELAVEMLTRHLDNPRASWAPERAASMRYIGLAYKAMGDMDDAELWFHRAAAQDPMAREPLVELALMYHEREIWPMVKYFAGKAVAIRDRPTHYISEARSWGGLPQELLASGLG